MESFFSNTLVAALVLIGVLVFIHECGHFLVGKFFSIAVESFSLGFGPQIFSFRKGLTTYQISILPLGGFVKFYGMRESEVVPDEVKESIKLSQQAKKDRKFFAPPRLFYQAPTHAKLAVIAAGPIANFLLAVVAFSILGGAGIQTPLPVIGDIQPGSPAERAGLESGDLVTAVDDQPIKDWFALQELVSKSVDKTIVFHIVRDEQSIAIKVRPEVFPGYERTETGEARGRAGFSFGERMAFVRVFKDNPWGLENGDLVTGVSSSNAESQVDLTSLSLRQWRRWVTETLFIQLSSSTPVSTEVRFVKSKDLENVNILTPERLAALGVSKMVVLEKSDLDQPFFKWGQVFSSGELVVRSVKEGYQSKFTVDRYLDKGHLLPGDTILSWNGKAITDLFSLLSVMESNLDSVGLLEVERRGQTVSLEVKLEPFDRQLMSGVQTIYRLPVDLSTDMLPPPMSKEVYEGVGAMLQFGLIKTTQVGQQILSSVWSLLSGQLPLKALGGPLMIGKVAGDAAKAGWQTFLGTLAVISINLGILNLIPIPVLDGGQIVMITLEGLRRKKLSDRFVDSYQKIGFVMVLTLIFLAFYNDLSRFWIAIIRNFF